MRDIDVDRLVMWLDGQIFKGICWTLMVLAIGYFGSGIIRSDLCAGLIAALVR